MKRVVVLFHEHDRRCRGRGSAKLMSMIDHLGEAWRKEGIEVLYVFGTENRPEADLLIPHVDLTRRPPEYDEYIKSYPNVVNRDVTDISKRVISRNLLGEDDEYPEEVIVKTGSNAQGLPERCNRETAHPSLRFLRRLSRRIRAGRGQNLARTKTLDRYLVYRTLAEVPREVFRNPSLVVEKFLPEREGDRYFVRYYIFLGDHTKHIRLVGSDPILKAGNVGLAEEGMPVPDELVAMREKMGMDYGKIDYTMRDGMVAVLDANPTPSPPHGEEATRSGVESLAGGIWSLLERK